MTEADQALESGPNISIRARPPSPRRLSRKVLLAGCIAMGGVVVFALLTGLGDHPRASGKNEANVKATAGGPPDSIRQGPQQYGLADLPKATPHDFLWGDHKPEADLVAQKTLEPPKDKAWREAPLSTSTTYANDVPDPDQVARLSPILFGAQANAGKSLQTSSGLADPARSGFLTSQRSSGDRLDTSLAPPRSAFEILAGNVIPAALVTELNSDLPGRVIAQVTAPVYDSVTGDHQLIPQGARLIGTYDSQTTHGDNRLLLVWNRLILPNGWSINLEAMEAADPTGASGLKDHTDNHLFGLAGAIGMSAIISVVGNNAEGDDPHSFGQSIGDAAAQEAAKSGGRIVDRDLAIKPTLRIRPGAPVRVLVTRDIRLRPYSD